MRLTLPQEAHLATTGAKRRCFPVLRMPFRDGVTLRLGTASSSSVSGGKADGKPSRSCAGCGARLRCAASRRRPGPEKRESLSSSCSNRSAAKAGGGPNGRRLRGLSGSAGAVQSERSAASLRRIQCERENRAEHDSAERTREQRRW